MPHNLDTNPFGPPRSDHAQPDHPEHLTSHAPRPFLGQARKDALVSVIVPVYNGARYLDRCVRELFAFLKERGYDWEIIVCEDGSTDDTVRLCKRLKSDFPALKVTHHPERLGRGLALMRAVERASGRYVVYVDVDLATDLAHLDELVAHVQNGSSISTGSRYARGSQTERKVSRFVTSLVYNSVVRLLLGSSLSDHQCGFKAFDRRALNRLLPHVNSHHWFWDTEVLVRAQAMGFKVAEVPVRWRESSEGTTVRLFHDVPYFLRELIDLRKDLRRQSS